jgi:hypothetical protein
MGVMRSLYWHLREGRRGLRGPPAGWAVWGVVAARACRENSYSKKTRVWSLEAEGSRLRIIRMGAAVWGCAMEVHGGVLYWYLWEGLAELRRRTSDLAGGTAARGTAAAQSCRAAAWIQNCGLQVHRCRLRA